ncbi:hypothetical protein [uncultured Clostridium sp.]|uniref:hypothetical protein n=1 Tax=uncultured Clostridium sp. TaxID=59620 RepID=UPI0028E50AB4|nr:hypothetical protein [uncultured Clostridium sp.]
MKVVAKPIEVICWFNMKGIHPIKFRIEEEGKYQVIKIEKVISSETEKLCGNRMILFTCNAIIDNVEKIFEIKYDIEGCAWLLYKI